LVCSIKPPGGKSGRDGEASTFLAEGEPGEDDTPEVQQHNAFLARRLKQKQDAKERLKSKGAVPSRNGKPIFEGSGDVQQFALSFRRHYYSSRPLRFKEWIEVVAELLDDL